VIRLTITQAVAERATPPDGPTALSWRVVDAARGTVLAYCDTESEAQSVASAFNAVVRAYSQEKP